MTPSGACDASFTPQITPMVGINHFLGRGDRMRGRNGGFGPPAEASSVLIVGEGRGRLDGLRCTLADIPRLVLSLHIIDSSLCVCVSALALMMAISLT